MKVYLFETKLFVMGLSESGPSTSQKNILSSCSLHALSLKFRTSIKFSAQRVVHNFCISDFKCFLRNYSIEIAAFLTGLKVEHDLRELSLARLSKSKNRGCY